MTQPSKPLQDDPCAPQTLAPRHELCFYDSRSVDLGPDAPVLTALQAWTLAMSKPLPFLKTAFKIRDAIAARFGVKRIDGFSDTPVTHVEAGDKLDFFLVEGITPHRLTLTERDTHLDVMTCVTTQGGRVTITSSVLTHNWLGKAYMWPVAPAHKLIVTLTLARLKRAVAQGVVMGHETSPPGS